MRVKRYVVDSMPDALQKIRTDLGKDAVIMNTKEIRSGGFLGFFSKKRIEVIAAIEQENTVKTAKEPPVSRPKAKSAAVPAKSATAKRKEQPAQPEPVKPVPAVPAATVPKAYKAAVAVSSPHDQPAEAVKEVSQLSTAFLSEMKAFREEAAETSDQAGEPEVPHSSREDVLLSEIQQMKAMMAQMSAVGCSRPLPGQSRLLVWSVISGTRGLIRSGLKNCLIKRIPPPRVHKQHGLRMSSGSRLLRS
ncbi:hypothetical protein P7H12_15020 [Paenibacillus larvae]|nr:hypothetical protein [Paenibacillus larvae]MDT2264620.1 hypothetical protein [Paenibacillus larvae]